MEFPRLHHKSYETLKDSDGNLTPTKCGRAQILKNLLTLCTGTLFLFIAYDALTMLQSTMNRESGIGVTSQATLYACFCVSAILLPKLIISKFGSKTTSVAAMFAYLPYIASNYYPHWSLMIPSSILLGIAGPLLWASYGVYLNGISAQYSDLLKSKEKDIAHNIKFPVKEKRKHSNENVSEHAYQSSSFTKDTTSSKHQTNVDSTNDSNWIILDKSTGNQVNISNIRKPPPPEYPSSYPRNPSADESTKHSKMNEAKGLISNNDSSIVLASTTAKFFGFHGMSHLSCHVWSSLLSYFILKTDIEFEDFKNSSCTCGASFCNDLVTDCFESNAGDPSTSVRYILTSICVCMCLFSILIVGLFLEQLEQEKKQLYFSFDFLKATYTILKRKEMLLLIPLSVHTGLVQGFYVGDFNKSYIACAWGTYHVGLVALCYGILCGVSSVLAGVLVRIIGRRLVLTCAAVVNIISIAYLFMWIPDPRYPKMFFFAAGLWGIHVGIVWSQLRAFYGVLFQEDEEAAFSAFHMWSALGSCIAFGYSNFFCISLKLYIILAVTVLGFAGYYIVEMTHCKNKTID
ncbi:protein unc-93 homolog A [Caerostris extrusa]|uniref:Protein unc-93 homolog A n=1 Tax=Caerostris extrusa TaxID=172846 RepID=A0AAV4W4P9_CAEEX|nr:protein unc-93 homolog A [Caerostris extrusa]